jgi:hypothetical protein
MLFPVYRMSPIVANFGYQALTKEGKRTYLHTFKKQLMLRQLVTSFGLVTSSYASNYVLQHATQLCRMSRITRQRLEVAYMKRVIGAVGN